MSVESLEEALRQIETYSKAVNKGIDNAVKTATETLYRKVIDNCDSGNLSEFTDAVKYSYDKKTNVGKVYVESGGYDKENGASHGLVIIINEFGSGIKGTQDAYADAHNYQVNMSEKGERGWAYPKKDGTKGWTHGIRSKRMFFEAYGEVKEQFKNIVDMSIDGEIGKLYDNKEG